jgi:hypothetical protein
MNFKESIKERERLKELYNNAPDKAAKRPIYKKLMINEERLLKLMKFKKYERAEYDEAKKLGHEK